MSEKRSYPNILLVDDKEEGLLALETVLKGEEYNLFKARSGSEALKLLLTTQVSVILMDVQMPEMDGFETATYIKKREKTKNIPIIFVSGLERNDEFISHGYESGAVDYIFKPFDPHILRTKVAVFVDLIEQTRKVKSQAEKLVEIQRTEQSRELERLEFQSRTRYQNLADAIPHIIWKANSNYMVDHLNRTWVNYTGIGLEQSLGSGWRSAIHAKDLLEFLAVWKDGNQNQKEFEYELRIFSKKHQAYRWHLIKAVPDQTEGNLITSWLLSGTEIHPLKEVESKLIEAKIEADTANRAKSFFLANMSHEIRTPLGAIMGFSDLLLQADSEPHEVVQHAQTIKNSGEQLLKIIDEILDISKVESGSLQVVNEKIFVKELVESIQTNLKIQAAKKNLKITIRCETPVPEYFYSDSTRVRQILLNIIGNAVKFSSAGEVSVNLRSTSNSEDDRIYFVIKDSGNGIDEKYMKLIFRPFSQGDSSTARKYGGTGLGLALSRKLARALGGDVELTQSEKGVGSTFTVSLATQLNEKVNMITKITDEEGEAGTTQRKTKNQIQRSLVGVKVLVAEDALENQRLLTWFLEKAGASVELANNGREAIDKALSGHHDLVLMDIQMPEVDGYEATKTLRERGYSTPILAVTAHALLEERQRCLDAGCTDHLSKPIDVQQLLAQVNRYHQGLRI